MHTTENETLLCGEQQRQERTEEHMTEPSPFESPITSGQVMKLRAPQGLRSPLSCDFPVLNITHIVYHSLS